MSVTQAPRPDRWPFDNTYARELRGLYRPWQPESVPAPQLVACNDDLAGELGLDAAWLRSPQGVAVLAGNAVPDGATPLAQAYAGHQFGSFQPLLGDGRALVLGEVVDTQGRRRDIAFKGSGPTPFSRGGDGKAVLGPVLREYIVAEAMHALGIPTTRALAAVRTGEKVWRTQGSGAAAPQHGAILTRIAASHLRVGTFQLVRARGTEEQLGQLADYAIARHYPHLAEQEQPYQALLGAVVRAQAQLIAQWMSVGFIHGVMNTDNMTISGETIDYGPCAFMDTYSADTVFSSIDSGGRYRFANQPAVAAWNLARFAETLLPLLDSDPDRAVELATNQVNAFGEVYEEAWLARMKAKLGLPAAQREGDPIKLDAVDRPLIADLLELLQDERLDYTSTWRALARDLADSDAAPPFAGNGRYSTWRARWVARLGDPCTVDRVRTAAGMDAVNPMYVPRNHLVEEALAAARSGDLAAVEDLLSVVMKPFVEQSGRERYATAAPPDFNATYVTYCGT